MPAQRKNRLSADTEQDKVGMELRQLRTNVAGVTGSLAATSDGLVVAHDIPDAEPSQIAALAAATLALASRATLATGCGAFREAVARGTDGYLAVYAADHSVIVAVIGKSSLNVGMLQYRARGIIERIAEHSAKAVSTRVTAPAGATTAPSARGRAAAASTRPAAAQLPKRRPAAS
jgi:predicted regulator of Ras-like GTPase activity (Roadblock/LC7/MglB family)